MSWGEQQQPPYDPSNPYGQAQQPYQQPSGQMPPQQQPPDWATPQQQYPNAGPGYPAPVPDPNAASGQNPFQVPAAPYQQVDYSQFQPPPKKGNGVLIGIVVGAVVVVGGGIAAAVLLTSGHKSGNANTTTNALSVPGSVNGLTLLHTSQADAAVNAMKSSFAGATEQFPDPIYGAYNDSGGNDVTTILVDQSLGKLSAADQAQLKSSGPSDVVAAIMSGAGVSDAKTESTNASNGALSCGTKQEQDSAGDNIPVTICVWYDGTTYGTLQYVDHTDPGTAAPVADAVRAAAEG